MENIVNQEVEEETLEEVMEDYEQSLNKKKEALDNLGETVDKVSADQEALARELAEKEAELFQKEVAFTLKENGLEMFADVINVTDSEQLETVVKQLTAIVNDIKIGAGYVPKDNAKQAEYDVFTQKKDTRGMIGSKLANLFK